MHENAENLLQIQNLSFMSSAQTIRKQIWYQSGPAREDLLETWSEKHIVLAFQNAGPGLLTNILVNYSS